MRESRVCTLGVILKEATFFRMLILFGINNYFYETF